MRWLRGGEPACRRVPRGSRPGPVAAPGARRARGRRRARRGGHCSAAIRVPALPRCHDGGARRDAHAPAVLGISIALALHLWLEVGFSDRFVHKKICAWQVRGRSGRGWAQLYRWARSAASLFGLPHMASTGAVTQRVLITLRAMAPVALSASPIALQVFEGAARMQ